MQCFRCQFEVADFAVYCNRCGVQLRTRCADCGRMNPGDSLFCDACGKQLRSPEPTDQPPSHKGVPPPPQSNVNCPRCSAVNESGAVYCYSCGLPLDEAQPGPSSPTSTYAQHEAVDFRASTDQPAGFWIRLFAFLIDIAIVFLASVVIASALGYSFADWLQLPALQLDHPIDWINIVIDAVYFTIAVAAFSTTIAKAAFGLKVVRNDGSKIGIGRAFARYCCYNLSILIFGIGFLMIAFRKDKRGLHDLICGTVVVYR